METWPRHWEKIFEQLETTTRRLKVPGGWLVSRTEFREAVATSVALCFVADPGWEWELENPVPAGKKTP